MNVGSDSEKMERLNLYAVSCSWLKIWSHQKPINLSKSAVQITRNLLFWSVFPDQTGRVTLMRAAYRQGKSGTIERLKRRWCLDVFHNKTTSHRDNQTTLHCFIIVKLWSFQQNHHVIAFNVTFVLNSFVIKLLKHLHMRTVKNI